MIAFETASFEVFLIVMYNKLSNEPKETELTQECKTGIRNKVRREPEWRAEEQKSV